MNYRCANTSFHDGVHNFGCQFRTYFRCVPEVIVTDTILNWWMIWWMIWFGISLKGPRIVPYLSVIWIYYRTPDMYPFMSEKSVLCFYNVHGRFTRYDARLISRYRVSYTYTVPYTFHTLYTLYTMYTMYTIRCTRYTRYARWAIRYDRRCTLLKSHDTRTHTIRTLHEPYTHDKRKFWQLGRSDYCMLFLQQEDARLRRSI